MITDLVVVGVMGLLTIILEVLPDDTLDWPSAAGMGADLGELAGPLDALLPVSEMALALTMFVTVVLPGMIVYKAIVWVWARIPVIGGG